MGRPGKGVWGGGRRAHAREAGQHKKRVISSQAGIDTATCRPS